MIDMLAHLRRSRECLEPEPTAGRPESHQNYVKTGSPPCRGLVGWLAGDAGHFIPEPPQLGLSGSRGVPLKSFMSPTKDSSRFRKARKFPVALWCGGSASHPPSQRGGCLNPHRPSRGKLACDAVAPAPGGLRCRASPLLRPRAALLVGPFTRASPRGPPLLVRSPRPLASAPLP